MVQAIYSQIHSKIYSSEPSVCSANAPGIHMKMSLLAQHTEVKRAGKVLRYTRSTYELTMEIFNCEWYN